MINENNGPIQQANLRYCEAIRRVARQSLRDEDEEATRMIANADTLSLSSFGNVPMTYTHEWRVAEPQAPLVLPGAVFKWYHVHRAGVAIPADMDAEARAVIADVAAQGAWTM